MESELIQIIATELALFPPVADRVAVEVAELHHDVDRAAAKPDERLDDLHPLLCAAHPYDSPSALFWPRISTAVPYSGFTIDEYTYALTASTAIRGPIPNLPLT